MRNRRTGAVRRRVQSTAFEARRVHRNVIFLQFEKLKRTIVRESLPSDRGNFRGRTRRKRQTDSVSLMRSRLRGTVLGRVFSTLSFSRKNNATAAVCIMTYPRSNFYSLHTWHFVEAWKFDACLSNCFLFFFSVFFPRRSHESRIANF